MANLGFAGGRILFEMDGQLGFINSMDGGYIKGDIVTSQRISMNPGKHLATIKHEPFSIEVGLSKECTSIYDWIQATMDLGHVRKDGAFVRGDFDFNAMTRTDFFGAVITEVGFPAMDGSSKDRCNLTVKAQPNTYRNAPGDGAKLPIGGDTTAKKWLASNFRVEFGDLPCEGVRKIDAFAWKQSCKEDARGTAREPEWIPTKVEVPNLKLTIGSQYLDPWVEWHKSFVIDGKCTDADEITGALTYLGPDLQEELASVEFKNVGIFGLKQSQGKSNSDELAAFEVELYVEEMTFIKPS